MARLLLLNGPNLNLLARRESEIYGTVSLEDIEAGLGRLARELGHELETFQSNAEHRLIERIHEAARDVDCILFNPGGFTHTSVALRDALLGVAIPFVEIHLSNIAAREDFRRHSYFSDIALGHIAGFGGFGYQLALRAAVHWLKAGK
ncbi:MAG: type II 3-dehydroquinate dehydratase [Gammaproteobacteria bacterium]|nr:type II 3-dehydroquinate dehydratase [Gammaproteobacteria bacterium]